MAPRITRRSLARAGLGALFVPVAATAAAAAPAPVGIPDGAEFSMLVYACDGECYALTKVYGTVAEIFGPLTDEARRTLTVLVDTTQRLTGKLPDAAG